MADIYIIYCSKDRPFTTMLASELSKSWDVWWDDKIVGSFAPAIERELPAAKVVVALWSTHSRDSDYVRDELTIAKKLNLPTIAVRIEECEPPFGFGGLSIVELRDWTGESEHHGLRQLLRRIGMVVAPRAAPTRPNAIGNSRVQLPALFMSVSSHETQLSPIEAVKALRLFKSSTILVSAYDLTPDRIAAGMVEELARFRADGGFVLVDSGNYEASRLDDDNWSPKDLALALNDLPHDWAFCFDEMKPSRVPSESVAQVVSAVRRDQHSTTAPVLPIVHAPRDDHGTILAENLPIVIRDVARVLEPPMVAVPERELGSGLVARAKTVRRIRQALAELPFYQPVHLLGTGNPWSIAVLAAAGADSFDGLEWCRVAVDGESGRLHHYQHFDFFAYQARLADSPVTAEAVDDEAVEFAGKVAFHNLDFFANFASRLRHDAARGGLEAFVMGWLGQANTRQLLDQMPELFS